MKSLIDSVRLPVRLVAFDLDGVLYRGKKVLPGARECLDYLKDRGLLVRYVTNNSTLHRFSVAGKLEELGLSAHADQVVGSAWATATWLSERLPGGALVLYLGEEGLGRELREAGFNALHVPTGKEALVKHEGCIDAAGRGAVAAVVVGLDRTVTYWALAAAQHAVLGGALFVATNGDTTIPVEERLFPGGGSIVAAVAAAVGQEPLVIGKPGLMMAQVLEHDSGVSAAETLFVGDRLDTDIAFGNAAGMVTALVLTGVARREDLVGSSVRPHYVLETLFDLPGILG